MAKRRSGPHAAKRKKTASARGARPDAALDALPVGFARFDPRQGLAAWNRAFATLGGYPRALLRLGTPLERFVEIEVARGEHGDGDREARVRDRLAALALRKRTRREFTIAEGRE